MLNESNKAGSPELYFKYKLQDIILAIHGDPHRIERRYNSFISLLAERQ